MIAINTEMWVYREVLVSIVDVGRTPRCRCYGAERTSASRVRPPASRGPRSGG
jgi:hypothetical protein